MKWSWSLGRIAGIRLRVHATFALLLAWIALVSYRASGTVSGAAMGVLITLALFASVVLHELGHALVARRFGVATSDILLLPIGGVARLDHIPERPAAELWIAAAGPAVTLAIVLVLYTIARLLVLPIMRAPGALTEASGGAFLLQLMWVNVSLLVFNLLPAFPMDGGRVLRALLALRIDYLRATQIAARIGRGFALLFGVLGLLYNPFLLLIALFVWLGATGEASAQQVRSTLAGVSVEQAMVRDVRSLAPDDSLDTALRNVLGGFQRDFPVVAEGRVVGMLTRPALLTGLGRRGRESRVDATMDRSFPTADLHEPLAEAIARLEGARAHALPVLSEGTLCGMLTLEKAAEFLMVAAVLRSSPVEQAAD